MLLQAACAGRKYLHLWDSLDDLAAVCSGYPLVSSKLVKMLGFEGYLPLPLPLPLDQNQN